MNTYEWISLKEKLPIDGQKVFGYTLGHFGPLVIAAIWRDDIRKHNPRTSVPWKEEHPGGFDTSKSYRQPESTITYWFPFPELPESKD